MKRIFPLSCALALMLCLFLSGCKSGSPESGFSVDYEKYVLSNGLEVVLHEDHSDPIVAVAILYHVGSNREKPGKTGFAHFFEHMLFQRSENLARNEYISKVNDLGGSFNGGTWTDGTIYYEMVPNDALEKVLWMESDRMGFFINTVTQEGLEREIDVVVNEKRQGVDNRPYGHTDNVIRKALYPHGHPYSWTVIGEIADLQSATIGDVKEFYNHYYKPNNATLVIAGDFDNAQAKAWIEKYFGEIASQEEAEQPTVQVPELRGEVRLLHEDKFANMPEITFVYPAVEQYHPDAYALNILVELLADGKKAPLYKEIVENTKLAPSVGMYNNAMELAGEVRLTVRAFPDKPLDEVYAAIGKGMAGFEAAGVDVEDLNRIKATLETSFYYGISSVMNKAFRMAEANAFGGTPDKMTYDIDMLNRVTPEDVMRVYRTYIKDKPAVITSFVPKGKAALALAGSEAAEVTEEAIDSQSLKSEAGAIVDDDYERTPSGFDRSAEPALGTLNTRLQPVIWNGNLANGIKVYGIEQNELPLIYFGLSVPAGYISDPAGKAGVAYLTASLLREGTQNKTPVEMEDALKSLGASLSVSTGMNSVSIYGGSLTRNTAALVELITEMLTQPRWDEKEFERIKQQAITRLEEQKVQPGYLGMKAFNSLVVSEEPWAYTSLGTSESLQGITLDDVKQFFADYYTPAAGNLLITGKINRAETEQAFASLAGNWKGQQGKTSATPPLISKVRPGKVFFVDYPGSLQSYIVVGKRAMDSASPAYYPAVIANYKLGDGSGSDLFRVLRLERGYTYGAYSFFNANRNYGTFIASSSVQSTVTKESVGLFRDLISGYAESFTSKDLETTGSAMLRQRAGQYETIFNLLNILNSIVIGGRPADYLQQEENALRSMTLDEIKAVINKEMNFDDMIIVVVGDAKTQLSKVEELGLGKPELITVN